MKTGTLTWHFLNNYGSVLQAYALQKFINQIMNMDNEILSYYQKSKMSLIKSIISSINKNGIVTTVVAGLHFLSRKLHYINNIETTTFDNELFSLFRKQHLISTQETYTSTNKLKHSLQNYDAFIVGSDNVWLVDADTGKPCGLSNPNYFLNFVPAEKKRISYAASMGNPIVHKSGLKNFINLFETLDTISVREKCTADFLSSVLHREVAWVVDPTLLLTAGEWDEIALESTLKWKPESYIAVYVIYAMDEHAPIFRYANDLAHHLQKEIVYLGYHFQNETPVNTYVSVPDFLLTIKNAAFVLTNSFHGTVFSIIYRRAFAAFPPREGECRIIDILESFNLSERYMTSYDQTKGLPIFIDYADSEPRIEKRRTDSMEWLRKTMTEESKEES